MRSLLLLICLSGTAGPAWAQESNNQPPPLPEPLTLEQALELADAPHPTLLAAEARVDLAEADLRGADATDNWQAHLEGRLQWVEPSKRAPPDEHDDHKIGLIVSKPLYDFGRTESRLAAANADLRGSKLLYADTEARRRVAITAAFFDVLLADLAYTRDNEAMAVAFVNFDRQQDRLEQGKISDIDVLESEALFQEARTERYASDVRRRSTRARLALLLNRPGMLPGTLVPPELDLDRKLVDVEELQRLALQNNPHLEALRAQLEAGRARLQTARAGKRPMIRGEFEAAEYARELGSSDPLRAGVVFEMPLYSGGAVAAAIGRQQALLNRTRAELAEREMEIRQAVLELWQEAYVLGARIDRARVEIDYRDLYLDRSRALYELDVRTDLGDSMTRFSAARLMEAEAQFGLALTLARLEALLGQALPEANGAAPPAQ